MLMWAHYADRHQGVCLQFDSRERPVRGWKRFHYYPIQYRTDRRIDVFSMGINEAILRALTTKGREWQYEREHRLVTLKGPGMQPGRLSALTGIVIGTRAREHDDFEKLMDSLQANQERRQGVRKMRFAVARKVSGVYAVDLIWARDLVGAKRILDSI
jgi:hypothetical protein